MKKLISLISTVIIGAGAGLSAVACGSETKYYDPNINDHNNATIAIPEGVNGDDKKTTWDQKTMFQNQYTKNVTLFERQIEYNLAKADWTNWAAKYLYDNDTTKGEAYFNALVGTLVSNSLVQDLFGTNYKENFVDETSIRSNGYTLADRVDWHEYQTFVDSKYVDKQSSNQSASSDEQALRSYSNPDADPTTKTAAKLTKVSNQNVYKWKDQKFDAFKNINDQAITGSAYASKIGFSSGQWANYWNSNLINATGSTNAQNILASIVQRYNEYDDYDGLRSIKPINENGDSSTSSLYWDLSTYYNFKKLDMAETLLIMAWLNNVDGFQPTADDPDQLYFDFNSYLANRYIFSDGGQSDFTSLKTNTRMIWAQRFNNIDVTDTTGGNKISTAELMNKNGQDNKQQPSFTYKYYKKDEDNKDINNYALNSDWYTAFNFNNNNGTNAVQIKEKDSAGNIFYKFPVLDKQISRQFDPIFHGFGYAGSFIGKSTTLSGKLALSTNDIKNTSIAGWLKNSAYTDRYYYQTSDYKKIDRGYVLPIWLIDVLISSFSQSDPASFGKNTFRFVNPADPDHQTASTDSSKTSKPIAFDSSSTVKQWTPRITTDWKSETDPNNQGLRIWEHDPVAGMDNQTKQRILWWLEYELASNSSAFDDTGDIKTKALKFMFKKYKVTVHEKTLYNAWKNYLDSDYNKKEDE